MKYFRVSLVTVKSVFDIFCSEIKAKINASPVKGSGKDEIGTMFLKAIFTIRFKQFLHVIIHK